MSFLGLAVVLSVTNSGIPYSGELRWFHSLIILFVVLLCTGSVVWITFTGKIVMLSRFAVLSVSLTKKHHYFSQEG